MYKNERIIAIIPARGGSKGIKKKNIYPLLGKPLIEYTIKEAQKSIYLDEILISTDDKEIARIAQKAGGRVPFLRPPKISGDNATSEDVILHSLKWCKDNNHYYDYFVLLEPTSPLRKVKHIDYAIKELLMNKKANTLISVTKVRQHPYQMKIINKFGFLDSYSRAYKGNIRRQDLPGVYIPNGAIYISQISTFNKKISFYGGQTIPYIMKEEDNWDINTYYDIKIVESILKENN